MESLKNAFIPSSFPGGWGSLAFATLSKITAFFLWAISKDARAIHLLRSSDVVASLSWLFYTIFKIAKTLSSYLFDLTLAYMASIAFVIPPIMSPTRGSPDAKEAPMDKAPLATVTPRLCLLSSVWPSFFLKAPVFATL